LGTINTIVRFCCYCCILFTFYFSDKRSILNLQNNFGSILLVACQAIIGGRICIFSEDETITSLLDVFIFWQGGLSILGGIIGILVVVPFYLAYKQIPIIPFFDLVAVYAGLLQAVARIGCFFAGCCYGIATHSILAITYTDLHSAAPLYACTSYSALQALFYGLYLRGYHVQNGYFK
jgi:phosphatidylglycerol:prolipoprotein diacylglycerol transferase